MTSQPPPAPHSPYVLVLTCPDVKGVVAAVSSYLADNDASITESNHFNDQLTNSFSMRTAFRPDGPGFPDLDSLRQGFQLIARRFRMDWQLVDMTVKPKVVIAVSKFGHCLYDLLHRARSGSLPIDIPAVISNHDDMRSFVEWSGVPYHHLPVKGDKAAQEAAFMDVVNQAGADLVVLARYMQILSADLCGQLAGRCINIHHSFLPSFKGAKPYHQAHARGVKLIGATAHYVTTDLDEGPIIEQGIERVDHTQTPEDLVDIGRDIECAVLARAVRWHIERRILVTGQKTIVFS
ncbi:formyltetrahydrofolate deformylase [Nitrospirillum sp. BR 11164]|uniref:formyltetrahydrofolate deformylase n=1 Tax=Nitrospirillum sp. BR 11164 TaxID=3104324 RepID=UPI002AFF179A|nr:formyltetrahydrofolate deformylase [Nitrospirillum sp. BR 11164]MEA1648306.1 formyltetrahydrofolate deformylase [Nitrospirillum sp. BR 11164]